MDKGGYWPRVVACSYTPRRSIPDFESSETRQRQPRGMVLGITEDMFSTQSGRGVWSSGCTLRVQNHPLLQANLSGHRDEQTDLREVRSGFKHSLELAAIVSSDQAGIRQTVACPRHELSLGALGTTPDGNDSSEKHESIPDMPERQSTEMLSWLILAMPVELPSCDSVSVRWSSSLVVHFVGEERQYYSTGPCQGPNTVPLTVFEVDV